MLGSSGVGKSTLVNALLGEERQSTGAVRDDDSRGRHTTTHRELFELPGGALLIDTPGIRSLEVAGADEGVEAAFDDIIELAATCRFSDCGHDGEPGCAIEAAARRRDAQRRPGGQSPEARARAGPRGPQDRPARPGRAQAQVADHPQVGRPAHAQQVRRRPMTGIAETTTSTVWLDLPDAPPVPGLRFRAFRDLADYEPMSQVHVRGRPRGRHPVAPDRRPPAHRERGRRRDLAARRHRLRRDRRRGGRGRRQRPGRPRRRADLRDLGLHRPRRPPARDRHGAVRPEPRPRPRARRDGRPGAAGRHRRPRGGRPGRRPHPRRDQRLRAGPHAST